MTVDELTFDGFYELFEGRDDALLSVGENPGPTQVETAASNSPLARLMACQRKVC